MPLFVAFYEPEIIAQAAVYAIPSRFPELRLVCLLPSEEIAEALETAGPAVRELLVLDPDPALIGSGRIRAILANAFNTAASAFPGVGLDDIISWPELGGIHQGWLEDANGKPASEGHAALPEIQIQAGVPEVDGKPLRFYGQFDPPVDRVLYETYFRDLRGGFFIEAGASDGVEESCCKMFEEFLGWKGLNVEPSPTNFALLQQARPTAVNVRAALSDKDGTATFTNALHPERGARFGNGSLSHTEAHIEELIAGGCTFETFDVETVRYDTLLARHGIEHVDLFVLDVEGHERSALRGMEATNVWPRVFCIEHGNIGLENLTPMLEAKGYTLDLVAFNNAYFSLRP